MAQAVLRQNPAAANVYCNAVHFYKFSDPPFAHKLAEEGLASYPAHARIANAKGTLLALTILGVKQVDRFDRANAFDDSITRAKRQNLRARNWRPRRRRTC